MKCDLCDKDATVREVTVRNGVRVERHLCEHHAAEQGISVQPPQGAGEMIKQALLTHQAMAGMSGAAAPAPKPSMCANCRMTFAEFKQHGLLGCAACYSTFESQLAPLLERAHDGAEAHVGKAPRRACGEGAARAAALADLEIKAQQLRRVREALERAVRAEQYEHAARLRDEMRRLTQACEAPPAGQAPGEAAPAGPDASGSTPTPPSTQPPTQPPSQPPTQP